MNEIKQLKEKIAELEELLQDAYDHLNYCGYGDAWERECSVELQKRLDKYFEEKNK